MQPPCFEKLGVNIYGDLKCVKPTNFETGQCLTGLYTNTEIVEHSYTGKESLKTAIFILVYFIIELS